MVGALAASRESEARQRDRAGIVLLAAAGTASRAMGCDGGCTPGTASKWQVRHGGGRMAGLSETGDRGNNPKRGPEHGQRIGAPLTRVPVDARLVHPSDQVRLTFHIYAAPPSTMPVR